MGVVRLCRPGLAAVVVLAAICGAGAQAPAQSTKPGALQPSERTPITVQPNLGTIDASGGVQFAPDGRYLAVGNERQIKLWDVRTGRPLRTLEDVANVEWFTFIDNGARILSLHRDGRSRIWDPLTGKLLKSAEFLPADSHPIAFVAHHPERRLLAIGLMSHSIILWDYAKGRRLAEIPATAATAWLSKDGKRLKVASGSTVEVFNLATRRVVSTTSLSREGKMHAVRFLDDTLLVAKTKEVDCDADVLLVSLTPREHRRTTIDKAPGCKKDRDGNIDTASDSLMLFHDEDNQRLYISRVGVPGFKVWDLAANRAASPVGNVHGVGSLVGVDRNFAFGVFDDGHRLRIVSLDDGRQTSELAPGHGDAFHFAIASADGRQIMLVQENGGNYRFTVWPVDGGTPQFYSLRLPDAFTVLHAVPGANLVLASDDKGRISTHSLQSGREVSAFSLAGVAEVNRARLSPDGRHILMSVELAAPSAAQADPDGNATYLVDARTGKVVREFRPGRYSWEGYSDGTDLVPNASAFAFSADGKRFAIAWMIAGVEIWSLDPLGLVKGMGSPHGTSVAFSEDTRMLVVGSRDEGVFIFSVETGKMVRAFERSLVAGHVNTASVAVSPDGALVAAGPGQRAVSSGDIGRERRVQVWETASGKVRYLLSGHEANVHALVFTSDNRWLVSGSGDGTIRYWDRKTGQLGATFAAAPDGRWVIVTDKGFFAASADAGDLLSVVRGFESYSVMQVYKHLYRPDLVQAALKGDLKGAYKDAAFHLNLETILDTGPAPRIEHAGEDDRARRRYHQAHGADRRHRRRHRPPRGVEGQRPETGQGGARGAEGRPGHVALHLHAHGDAPHRPEQGQHRRADRLQRQGPARHAADPDHGAQGRRATAGERARMHVLAIGVDEYRMQSYKLKYAVNDTLKFSKALEIVGSTLFAEVKPTILTDKQVTEQAIASAFDRIGADAKEGDVFVLYLAGHGKAIAGKYYYYPQTLEEDHSVEQHAIGQDKWETWLAKVGHVHEVGALPRHLLWRCRRCPGARRRRRHRDRHQPPQARHRAEPDRGLAPGSLRGLQGPRRAHLRAAGGPAQDRRQRRRRHRADLGPRQPRQRPGAEDHPGAVQGAAVADPPAAG